MRNLLAAIFSLIKGLQPKTIKVGDWITYTLNNGERCSGKVECIELNGDQSVAEVSELKLAVGDLTLFTQGHGVRGYQVDHFVAATAPTRRMAAIA